MRLTSNYTITFTAFFMCTVLAEKSVIQKEIKYQPNKNMHSKSMYTPNPPKKKLPHFSNNKKNKTPPTKQDTKPLKSLEKEHAIALPSSANSCHKESIKTYKRKESINQDTSPSVETKHKVEKMLVKNNITKNTVTYSKHWYKPSPTEFFIEVRSKNEEPQKIISFNSDEEVRHESLSLACGQEVEINYHWRFEKFGKVHHNEHKKLTFIMPSKQDIAHADELSIEFNWDHENRISIAGIQPISATIIS